MKYARKLKRGLCVSVCVMQLFTMNASVIFAQNTNENSEAMTQEKIDEANNAYNNVDTKMEFLTMSDTEFMAKPSNASDSQSVNVQQQDYLYKRIASWAKNKNFDIEAIMLNGDVVGGNDAEYNAHVKGDDTMVQGWYRAVDQVLTQNFGDDVNVMMSSGNHDIADLMGDTFDENHKDDENWFYGDRESEYVGNFHTKINDLDFITLDYNGKKTYGYTGQRSGYQDFLKETLASIRADASYDAAKPIFIQAHSGYAGTSLGGNFHADYDTMGNDLQTIIKEYPQVILFSAHTHFPVEQETSIYQNNVTFVENGSMNYIYLDTPSSFVEGGYFNSNTGNADTTERSCNFVSILEDGSTIIRRFDVSNQRWIGMPWIVDTSKGKEGFQYTDAKRSNVAPWFEESATVTTQNVSDQNVILNFTQAVDDELVNYYDVQIRDAATNQPVGMQVKQLPDKSNTARKAFTGDFKAYSRFYYRPNTMSFDIAGLEAGRSYHVSIYAIDDFENRSSLPLQAKFKTTGTISLPEINGITQLPENIQEGKYFEMLFDGDLRESIANTSTAKANGSISYADSLHNDGKAVRVGGKKSDYIDLGQREEWNLGVDKDITINFWIKVTSNSGYAAILSNKNWSNYYRKGINIAPESSNTSKLEFTLGDDKNGVYSTGIVDNYKGDWHMMSFTIDREAQKMATYYDGVLMKDASIEHIGDATSNLNMLIGLDAAKTQGTIGFDMDDLTMWDRPLRAEDIQALYHVTNNYSSEVQKAIAYAIELQEEIKTKEANGQVYDEESKQELVTAFQLAQEDGNKGTLSVYLRLKTAIETLQSQSVYYRVQASASYGSITPQRTKVEQGNDISFALTPTMGYHIDTKQITLQNRQQYEIIGNTLTVKNATAPIVLQVTYVKDTTIPDDSDGEVEVDRVLQSDIDGIQLEGIFDKDVRLEVQPLEDTYIQTLLQSLANTSGIKKDQVKAAYDISLFKNSSEMNLEKEATIRMDLGEGWDTSKLAILHIYDNGNWKWLDCEVNDDRIAFTTESLSKFLVVEKESLHSQPSNENNSGVSTVRKSTNVKTSDDSTLSNVLLTMTLSLGIIITILIKTQRKHKEKEC